MIEGTVKVTVGQDYSAHVTVGAHTLIVDEPLHAGGKALGPDPYSYILSALGACTAITVRMYANRKNWPLEKVEVTLRHDHLHTQDCDNCEDPASRLDKITKELKLYGNLTEEQKHRLEIISSKCPIQKTLAAGIAIETVVTA